MRKFYNTILEEQETIINIDYYEGFLELYTSRKAIFERIEKKIGIANKIDYTNGLISGGRWKIPFSDKKKLTSLLSRPLLIGNIKQDN